MPLFYVDFQDGKTLHEDDEGRHLPSPEAARKEAIGMLPQVAKDELPDGEARDFCVVLRDRERRILYRATLTFRGECDLSPWISSSFE